MARMRLVRGGPGAGKTALVFREFKQALRAGARSGENDVRIVVPTATLVRHFQHELARDGFVFSPRAVVSLNRFILERAAFSQNKPDLVPDGLLRVIVRDCLERLNFPEFAAVRGAEGMTAAVIETIDLFENAGCLPETAGLSARKGGQYAKPFDKLWRAVRDRVHACGFQMRSGAIRMAASNRQPARVWMDGFLNFSPIEQEFLRALAAPCELTLTAADGASADEIRKLALQLEAKDVPLAGSPRKPRPTVIPARTLEREADEIARRVIALREQGTAFREIGVALRDASTYVPLLKGAFARFGIPARFYFSSPLRRHPAAIFLGGLISGALNNWDFETAIETFRAHPRWGARADFDRFDFAVRERMPGRGAKALLELCERDWLRNQIADCLKIEAWKDTPQKPVEWQRRFEALANSVYRPGTLAPPQTRADIESARSHTLAMRAWAEAVASVVPFWAGASEAISLEEFWRIASAAADAAALHPADDRANVVHVMSVYEARQWDVATLFVCGVTDRDFPRQHAQNLLFPDSEIERLRVPIRKASDHEREERALFDSLRTRATSSLLLSYPEHDMAGKSIQRSRFLTEESFGLDRPPEPARLTRPVPLVAAAAPGVAGRIGAPGLHAEMARLHQSISLTSLEDLAQCRFKFFSQRTLSLKPRPESPDKRLQARVTGIILHIALERWLADKTRNFVELFETVFDEECRKQHIPPGYRLEFERIRYRAIARRVSANDLWKPDSYDVEVPLKIAFPGGIEVNGRADRIDRFGNDCVIVDYKSSKTENVRKLVSSSTKLQGPLYAFAAREQLKLNPVAMVYWAVRDDELYGWGEIPGMAPGLAELAPIPENWAGEAKARSIERLSSLLRGEVGAHPEDPEQCRWCDFSAACRFIRTEQKSTAAGTNAA